MFLKFALEKVIRACSTQCLHMQDHHDVSYTAAPIKSFASASSKVSTEYHGNCTQLKDVVRGTMVINSTEEHPPSLRDAYDILRKLVAADDILRKVNARFSRFSDRYQKPVGASKCLGQV